MQSIIARNLIAARNQLWRDPRGMRATRWRAAARVGAWLLVLDCAVAQHTAAADDSSLDSIHSPNHFYARKPLNATEVDQLVFGVETSIEVGRSARCEQHSGLLNVQLAWTAKLGASVYSSPLIVQAAAAGSRSVWASTFVRYAESVDGIDGRECLASRVKPLLVINVHGVDDPFFDMIKIHDGEGSRYIHNELKAEFRIGPDNDIQPMQDKCLLRCVTEGELLSRSRSITPGREYGIEHLIQTRLNLICRHWGCRRLHGGVCGC